LVCLAVTVFIVTSVRTVVFIRRPPRFDPGVTPASYACGACPLPWSRSGSPTSACSPG
jgi:hypothetical protein